MAINNQNNNEYGFQEKKSFKLYSEPEMLDYKY